MRAEPVSLARAPTPAARAAIAAIAADGGWLPFDRFMALALYEPGLGYYARGERKFGTLPGRSNGPRGSDFVTAPEISPLFGRALAVQLAQALTATGTDELWEFGAGSGALAAAAADDAGRSGGAATNRRPVGRPAGAGSARVWPPSATACAGCDPARANSTAW